MDPLSVTASIITILSISRPLVQGLKRLLPSDYSRKEVEALVKELIELRNVIQSIDKRCSTSPKAFEIDSASSLKQLLLSTISSLKKLDHLCQGMVFEDPQNSSKLCVARLKWVKRASQFREIYEELRKTRSNLSFALVASNSTRLWSIEDSLQKLLLVAQRSQSNRIKASTTHPHSPDGFRESRHLLPRERRRIEYSFNSQSGKIPAISLMSRTTSTYSTSDLRPNEHYRPIFRSRTLPTTLVPDEDPGPTKACVPKYAGKNSTIVNDSMDTIIWRSSSTFNKLLGSLILIYSRSSTTQTVNCSSDIQVSVAAHLTYTFPPWLLAHLILCLSILYRPPSPWLTVSITRLRKDDDITFYLAKGGSASGLIWSFALGQAVPTEISYGLRRGFLHYAVESDDVEMTKMLLDHGADPRQCDANNRYGLCHSALAEDIQHALDADSRTSDVVSMIYERSVCASTGRYRNFWQSWATKFSYDEEDMSFTNIHKSLLGLNTALLTKTLDSNIENVDQADSIGRTPLYWAASNADPTSLMTILKYGADSNRASNDGTTPLMAAARGACKHSIGILLSHGADATAIDKHGRTALHWLSVDAPYIVDVLLNAGVDPDIEDNGKLSALHSFATKGFLRSIGILLNSGANPNLTDELGKTPLARAIAQNRHDCVLRLLKRGGRYATSDPFGHSLFHVAAWFANSATMTIIRENLHLFGENLNLKADVESVCAWRTEDPEKDSPDDCMMKRAGFSGDYLEPSLLDAWSALVKDARSWPS